MIRTISLRQLAARGVDLQPHEAVAITQELIAGLAAAGSPAPAPPFGPPSPENVAVTADGRVMCRACAATPATSEVGRFLSALLAGCPRVPGGLKYAVARALLEVDAPPFDSVHALSRTLVRFEQGGRRAVVRGVYLRAAKPSRAAVAVRRSTLAAAAAAAVVVLGLSLREDGSSRPDDAAPTAAAPSVAVEAHPTDRGRADEASAPARVAAPSPAPSSDRAPAQAGLVRAAAPAFSPSFGSGGAMLFHTGRTGDVRSDLVWRDAHGGATEVTPIVSDGARNYHPQLSPDGTRVAFDSDRDGERGVYVANADGTQIRRVSGPGHAAVPTWSPDGGRLAYVRADTRNPRVWNLWLLSLDSGVERRLTAFRYGQTWAASWFPDGRRIAFSHEDRLVVLDVDRARRRTYRTPVAGRLVRTPAVSPDGQRVIFQVWRSGAWVLHLADGRMSRVLDDGTAEEFAWSPDGTRVAFHSRRDGQWGIWLLRLGQDL